MDTGWNYRREHLRLSQRTHYVITNGGDQPNVVPRNAGVWYYYRESDEASIRNMWDIGNKMADGAALMTNTAWTSKVLGTAWPTHMNRTLAEVMQANIERVGLPQWSDKDVALAKATQRVMKVPEIGLATGPIPPLRGQERMPDEEKTGGPSDDIGDVTWSVPTVSLSYPANFQAGPGHNWANAIPMATPIAHKGVNAGARVQAATALDLLLRPDLLKLARAYFEQVQLKQHTYTPFLRADDQPATWLNKDLMERYRPALRKFYFDPSKYKTYLDQMKAEFGYDYPTIRP
jgi:aminobenzoyl-glutamate utilization protein B